VGASPESVTDEAVDDDVDGRVDDEQEVAEGDHAHEPDGRAEPEKVIQTFFVRYKNVLLVKRPSLKGDLQVRKHSFFPSR
jgi:hypothetical protein